MVATLQNHSGISNSTSGLNAAKDPERLEYSNRWRATVPSYPRANGAEVTLHMPPPPRMVTCELSRVVCCLSQRQHNPPNMQFTRKREKLVKGRKTALGAFRKKSG